MKQLALIPLLLSAIALGAQGAQTWYVSAGAAAPNDGSSAHPFATIQAAVLASGQGDLILVAPGSYPEFIQLGQGKTLRSLQGAEVTTIRAVSANPGIVEGFSIPEGAQLWWGSSLKRCVVQSVPNGYGVFADDYASIEHCVFTNCSQAIQVFGFTSTAVNVTQSIFFNNAALWNSFYLVATRCCLPVGPFPYSNPSSAENVLADPLFFDAAHGDYHLTAASPCIPYDIGVHPYEAAYPTYATEFCLGDGSLTACPCSNESATADGAGCRNSTGAGATLRADGRASVSQPSAVLRGASMPDGPLLYFQGSSFAPAFPFGNGLKCTGGALIRLGVRFNVAGASAFPDEAVSLSSAGFVTAPGVRMYQARYRDIMNSCSGENFNYTNGVSIDWHY